MVVLYSALILSLSFGVITKFEFLPSASIYLYDFFTIIILLIKSKQIFLYIKSSYRRLFYLYVFIMIAFIGIYFHVKTNVEFFVSLSYLIRVVMYLLLLVPLFSISTKSRIFLKITLAGSGLLFIIFGYLQYFLYPSLRNLFYLGWDEHLYRLFSTFLDPNFAGMFVVLTLLLYSYFLTSSFKQRGKLLKLLFVIGFVFLLPSLFLTYSRSSFIAFFISILLFLILIRKKMYVILFLLLFILSLVVLPKSFGGEGVNLFRTASLTARTGEYKKSYEIFLKNPIVGVGFNTLRYVSEDYGYVSHNDAISSHAAAGIPNSYLYILSITGILGVSIFLMTLYKLLKMIYQKIYGRDRVFAVTVLCSWCAVLVGSLFDNFLFYSPILIWLLLMSGLLLVERGKNKKT